ncbi:endonuclease/exonuclease/phosphatase family domain-containing protein 1-like isoform X2 [Sinocyclocheilus anshuiensis]|uniref:endonuclease/exonuclease/phosphatase family domain-containing protein 1-like isoform X2 n=1 Tax=Sinocyclocheilus anshuiensis TaxID=1608454 RepID=UPI0007BA1009|nr:PREDICTED: endonuclease/exonuclease/phosphatase family domain-containing protein 1-like isoform X2 [Sinocyclocheilus anshuiensis]
MGGNLGCHRSIPKDPTDFCQGKRKFSAACNFSHILVNQERLNINTATEEELMTLPGVNRGVARNIVEYRECIGGFKKVEDLALVSGVGATKLEAVKLEICVSSKSSSSNHSPSSLRKEQEHLPCTGVNINTATPPQLVSVRGITEKLAKSIVEFRSAHGPFRSIEDLVKVPSINSSLLDRIRFQVFVERSRTPSTNTNGGLTHPSPASFGGGSEELDAPLGGPPLVCSVRPCVEPPAAARDGKPAVRVATWNLQRCSSEKANNPGVREVVCMTLLENDIKLLAIQDLADREALDKAAEYSGFLWDSSSGIELKDATVLENAATNGNGKHPHPQPYLGHFYIGSSELTLVSLHLTAAPSSAEQKRKSTCDELKAHQLSAGLQETLKGERELLVLGHFGMGPDSPEMECLRKEKLSALLAPSVFTNISTRSPQGSRCLDNIWTSRSLKKIYTGHCWVVREGLTNPWIPDNWSWGGVASVHCPVVAEFFVDVMLKELLCKGNGVAVVERGDSMSKHER